MAKEKLSNWDKAGHLIVLAVTGIGFWCGVMSLVKGDPIVRYAIAGILDYFVIRELY